MAHSKYSASASHRWLLCFDSLDLCNDIPRQTSDAAEAGTKLHGYLAGYYQKKTSDKKIEFSEEELEKVQFCTDYIDKLSGRLLFELEVNYASFLGVKFEEAFGTSDVVRWDSKKRILEIVDFKFGWWEVDPTENSQLKLYALGALNFIEEMGWPEPLTVLLTVLQPSSGVPKQWDTTVHELKKWAETVKARIAKGKTGFNPGEHQCQFCPAKGSCQALAEVTLSQAVEGFESVDSMDLKKPLKPKKLGKLTPAQMAVILDNESLINGFLKAVKGEATALVEAGEEVPGYGIGESRTNRQWRREEDAKQFLTIEVGLEEEFLYKKSFLTPPQAEKLVKGKPQAKDLNDFIIKPPGVPVLKKLSSINTSDALEGFEVV